MLVGDFKHVLFSIIYGIIIPTDFFSEGLKPPTRMGFHGFSTSKRLREATPTDFDHVIKHNIFE